MRLVVASSSIQRRAVSTPLPERSSTIVIKMLREVLEHSRKAFKSGAETYAKIICVCVVKLNKGLWQ